MLMPGPSRQANQFRLDFRHHGSTCPFIDEMQGLVIELPTLQSNKDGRGGSAESKSKQTGCFKRKFWL